MYLRGGESRDDAKSWEDALRADLSVEPNPHARESGHFAISTMPIDTKERGNWQRMADGFTRGFAPTEKTLSQ